MATSSRGIKSMLRVVALSAIVLGLVGLALLVYAERNDRGWLTLTRAALFTDFREHEAFFNAGPDRAEELGFATDTRASLDRWREILRSEVDYVDQWLGIEGPTVERVKSLVLLFSRNGADLSQKPPLCGEFEFIGLVDTLQRIGTKNGYGCCSDHTVSFLALSSIAGIDSREIANSQHVIAEFYAPELSKWIYVDPQFVLMARDPEGNYLSLLELRNRYRESDAFEFAFFGNAHHLFYTHDPRENFFYNQPSDVSDYNATWGNDVFSQEEFRSRLAALPISIRQSIGSLTHQLPSSIALADETSAFQEALKSRRSLCLAILALWVLTHAAIPFWVADLRRRRASTQSA